MRLPNSRKKASIGHGLNVTILLIFLTFGGLFSIARAADLPIHIEIEREKIELQSSGITEQKNELVEIFVNKPITRKMGKKETHFYSFQGTAKKCLHLSIEQKGTDVIAYLISPSGEMIAFAERANTLQGPENMTFILPETGLYTVKLVSGSWVEVENGYVIELKPFSEPADSDYRRMNAEKIASIADSLSFDKDSVKRKESIEKFKEAIKIFTELSDDYEVMVAHYGLGWTYINEGEYEKASLSFAETSNGSRNLGDRFMLGHGLRGEAVANTYLGEYYGAIIVLEESVEIFRELKMLRYMAFGLQALGYARFFTADYSAALANFKESLVNRRKVEDQNGEILTLTALAKTYSKLGNNTLALEFIEQAKQKAPQSSLLTQTEILTEEGWILLSLGRNVEAEKVFNEALVNYQKTDAVSGLANVNCGLGIISRDKKDREGALFHFEKSVEMIEHLRSKLTDNIFRLSFSEINQSYYEIYIDFLMRLNSMSPDGNYSAKSLEVSEQARARLLLDMVRESVSLAHRDIPEELKNEYKLVRSRYISALREWKLQSLKNTKESERTGADLRNIILKKRNIEVKLNEKLSGKINYEKNVLLTARDIQNLLDEDTLLLEFGLYKNTYGDEISCLWAVTSNQIKGITLPSKRTIEEKAKRAYQLITLRNNLSGKITSPVNKLKIEKADKDYQQITGELSKMVFGELSKSEMLKSKKKLLIVTNGILQSIPFASLPDPLASGKYLTENYEISAVPSASILAALRRRNEERKALDGSKTVFVLADPVFSKNDERFEVANLKVKPAAQKTDSVIRFADYFSERALPRVFNTRLEAEEISTFVTESQKNIGLDFDASLDSLRKADLEQYKILHFATHALIDDENPELSGIVFSMIDKNRRPADGLLLYSDIFDLKLNAELVVLSGCRTGLGKPVSGEGFVGLTQSFIYAGTSRLLTSSWSVEDRATAQLIGYFYKNHLQEKMPFPAALRAAQLEMMKNPRWKSPYFWAPFTIQGEYR